MEIVKIGVGTLLIKDDLIFLSKRKGSHAQGFWGSTGGHLEFGESFENCARREALEEFGLVLGQMTFLCVSNIVEYDRHYVDVEYVSKLKQNQCPVIQEPDKFETCGWFRKEELPEPLFRPVDYAIKAFLSGEFFWDNV